MKIDILCIGNAIVDVFAYGSSRTAISLGLTKPVQHIESEKLNKILDRIRSSNDQGNVTIVSGGGAANTAKIAAHLGAKVGFIGALGRDIIIISRTNIIRDNPDYYGKIFRDELSLRGVELDLAFKETPTGLCLYYKTEKETKIAASPSASLLLDEEDISENNFKKIKIAVLDGYMLGREKLLNKILELSRLFKIPVALDLASTYNAKKYAGKIMEYIRENSMMLFMNEEEAGAFTREGEKFFISQTEGKDYPVFIVKLGGKGAVTYGNGRVYKAKTKKIKNAEATGAGDAFCAGFLNAWVQKKSLSDCTALGNEAARLVLNREGTLL